MPLTHEQLQLLHEDILTQPALDFVVLTPDGHDYIAGYYNALTVPRVGPVLMANVLIWAAQADRYQRIKAGISLGGGMGSICEVGIVILNNPQVPNLDLSDATIVALFDTLVAADILTQADKDALWALGAVTISRAQAVLGVPRITYVDVGDARTLL